MESNIFEKIDEIILNTKENKILWEKHFEIPTAYYFQFYSGEEQIQTIVDTYKAVFHNELAQCINFSVINWSKHKVYRETVRCKNSQGQFLEEYQKLHELYLLCKKNCEENTKNLNSLNLLELAKAS